MTTTKKAPAKKAAPKKAAEAAPAVEQETPEPQAADEDESAPEAPEADAAPEAATVEEEQVEDKPVAPAAATIEPRAPKEEEPTAAPLPSSADASAERLRVSESRLSITDDKGAPVDADNLFRPAGPGMVVCQVRLLEHATATMHNRPITRLLLAKGRGITQRSAQIITDRIREDQESAAE